jgi:hypothetical protein
MNPKLDALFNEPEKRYLNADELSVLSQYVSSIPERVKVYRQLRDQEIAIVQPVVDAVQPQFPDVDEATFERCVRNLLLILRYSATAMLMEDAAFVEARLKGWLPEMVKAYGTEAVDQKLLDTLAQRLTQALPPQHMSLLKPGFDQARALIIGSREAVNNVSAPLAGIL